MAKTETMYTRVEPSLKVNVERVLTRLGLTPSDAINIFLNQIVLQEGLPFEIKVPRMAKDEARKQLLAELQKSEDSIARGEPTYTLEEIKEMLGVRV